MVSPYGMRSVLGPLAYDRQTGNHLYPCQLRWPVTDLGGRRWIDCPVAPRWAGASPLLPRRPVFSAVMGTPWPFVPLPTMLLKLSC